MHELEAKFLTVEGEAPDAVLRRFQETLAWAGFRVEPEGRRDIVDTYFDTPDQRLRGAGWSYRRRQDDAGCRVALKEINRARHAVFDRQEVEQPVPDGTALTRLPPGPVQERLSNLLPPEAQVAPLFAVRNRRAAYRLSHPDHPRGLVEMALDQACIDADTPVAFSEVELELAEGPHELLAGVLAAAELEPALLAARLSKYERGLIAAGCPLERKPRPAGAHLNPSARWVELAVFQLRIQLARIKLFEPYAWEGLHPEGVHQMRVATRRARALLGTFAASLPEVERQAVEPRLTWLAGRLGAVRDLDVHLAHLADYREALAAHHVAALDGYENHLRTLRRQARRRLVEALDGHAYPELLDGFRGLLDAAARQAPADGPKVAALAGPAVEEMLERVLSRGRAIDDDAPAKRLHRLRIDVKRLRYQLEAVAAAYGSTLDPALDALKRLQDQLGLHQDADVARAHLAHYRKAFAEGKRARKAFKHLIEFEQRRARRQRKRFRRTWARFEKATADLPARLKA